MIPTMKLPHTSKRCPICQTHNCTNSAHKAQAALAQGKPKAQAPTGAGREAPGLLGIGRAAEGSGMQQGATTPPGSEGSNPQPHPAGVLLSPPVALGDDPCLSAALARPDPLGSPPPPQINSLGGGVAGVQQGGKVLESLAKNSLDRLWNSSVEHRSNPLTLPLTPCSLPSASTSALSAPSAASATPVPGGAPPGATAQTQAPQTAGGWAEPLGPEWEQSGAPPPSPPMKIPGRSSAAVYPPAHTGKKQSRWLPIFLEFINNLKIDSKDVGVTTLGDKLFSGQMRFLEELCEGLERGVRHFDVLKARQLGLTTITLAIDVFWLIMHDGLQAAIVTDTEGNRDKLRILLKRYIASLPKGLKCKIVLENRNNMEFENGSVLDWVVAGTKKKGGGLGKSRAYNFIHGTEVSAWGDEEGFASLKATMSQEHPDRLYIWESTAQGFNMYFDECEQAKKDSYTKKFIFIGWWGKDSYSLAGKPDMLEAYSAEPLTELERDRILRVKTEYDIDISMAQIAWYRWYQDSHSSDDGLMAQNYPWYADEAFVMTGSSFFNLKKVTEDIKSIHDIENGVHAKPLLFKGYRYQLGNDFMATEIFQVRYADKAELKIWEEPVEGGKYAFGCDPAYGRNDWADRSVIQVYRCYADRLVQVAEFASADPTTRQVTWVLAHLAGLYRDCMINLEVFGPGMAIIQEFDHLRQLLAIGALSRTDNEAKKDARGIVNFFGAARWYLYHKPDSPGKGYVYGWQTNAGNKMTIMNQMRDAYSLEQLQLASIPLLEEMSRVVQQGSHVGSESDRGKDDRVIATALAVKAWVEWIRKGMVAQGESFEVVSKRESPEGNSPHGMIGTILTDYLKRQDWRRQQMNISKRWGL